MKKTVIWFFLLEKRILKRKMFQITLLLIPLLIFILHSFAYGDDSMIRVALYTDGSSDSFSQQLIQKLTEKEDSLITYYQVSSREVLMQDVLRGTAECGYLFPEFLDTAIEDFAQGKTNALPYEEGVICLVQTKSSLTARIFQEVLYSECYDQYACAVALDFLIQQHPELAKDPDLSQKFQDYFQSYLGNEVVFQFKYADGSNNTVLNDQENINYYMMPVRGLLALLTMMAGMSGILMYYEDQEKGYFQWIRLKRRSLFFYGYLLLPVLLVGSVSWIGIFFSGISGTFLKELAMMMPYLLLVTGFCNLLRLCCKNSSFLSALMPLYLLVSLILCPIFISLPPTPWLRGIRYFLPANYYLQAFSDQNSFYLLIFASLLVSAGTILMDHFKNR